MKNILTVVSLSFLYSTIIAQSFPPIEQFPTWHLSYSSVFGSGIASIELLEEVDLCGSIWTRFEETIEDGSILKAGFFRQEGNKYYYRSNQDCNRKEYLLYDFSLGVGDSTVIGIPGTYFSDLPELDTVAVWVSAIDTSYYGGIPRRTLSLSYSPNSPIYFDQWIEGIGSSYHPFHPATCIPWSDVCETTYSNLCLSISDEVVYSTSNFLGSTLCSYELSKYYVDKDVESGDEDGSSWEDAFATLSEALDRAVYGDTIWVAEGVYYPTEDNDRAQSFELRNGVVLIGGFNGTEQHLEERDFTLNKTVLSGNIGNQEDDSDNSYHVVFVNFADSTTVLDGFTLERGYAVFDNSLSTNNRGGGILFDTSLDIQVNTPSVRNCVFDNNTAVYGGAVYIDGETNTSVVPSFYNCQFINNIGTLQGGAIYRVGEIGTAYDQRFETCIFTDNHSWQGGGAMLFSQSGGNYTFEQCSFVRDSSFLEGGAIYYSFFSSDTEISVNECSFTDNIGLSGGAIFFLTLGSATANHKVFITSSEYKDNVSRASSGGAIALGNYSDTTQLIIEDTRFQDNLSNTSSGGAIFISNQAFSASRAIIKRCFFSNNQGAGLAGGAITIQGQNVSSASQYSSLAVDNSVFHKNKGSISIGRGFDGTNFVNVKNSTFVDNGIYPFSKSWNSEELFEDNDTRMEFFNSIIWEESSALPQIMLNGSFEFENLYGYKFTNTLINKPICWVAGGDTACEEGNLFEVDPLFVNEDLAQFQLRACSPAINAGTNDILEVFPMVSDVSGNSRILNDTIDIGAYEREKINITFDKIIVDESSPNLNNGSISISNLEGGTPPYAFTWDDNSMDSMITGLSAGTYSLTITDAEGCSKAMIFNVDLVTNTNDIIYSKPIVYPNITSDVLQVDWNNISYRNSRIILTDIAGNIQMVRNKSENRDSQAIDLTDFPSGMYFLKVIYSKNHFLVQKIIKKAHINN